MNSDWRSGPGRKLRSAISRSLLVCQQAFAICSVSSSAASDERQLLAIRVARARGASRLLFPALAPFQPPRPAPGRFLRRAGTPPRSFSRRPLICGQLPPFAWTRQPSPRASSAPPPVSRGARCCRGARRLPRGLFSASPALPFAVVRLAEPWRPRAFSVAASASRFFQLRPELLGGLAAVRSFSAISPRSWEIWELDP